MLSRRSYPGETNLLRNMSLKMVTVNQHEGGGADAAKVAEKVVVKLVEKDPRANTPKIPRRPHRIAMKMYQPKLPFLLPPRPE